jgi:hypothetical protein
MQDRPEVKGGCSAPIKSIPHVYSYLQRVIELALDVSELVDVLATGIRDEARLGTNLHWYK